MERFSALVFGIYTLVTASIDCSRAQSLCPRPNFPENGDYSPKLKEFQLGDTINYTCGKDFILRGAQTSTCKSYGDWSNPTPFCDLKTFRKIPSIVLRNGTRCQNREIVDANRTTCVPLRSIEAIEVNLSKKIVLDYVDLFLGSGAVHILITTGKTTCGQFKDMLVRSQWVTIRCKYNAESTDIVRIWVSSGSDGSNSICEINVFVKEEILCNRKDVTRPSNGFWEFRDPIERFSAGTKRYLKCDPGYRKTGEHVIECQNNGTWTKSNATCVEEEKSNTGTIIYSCVDKLLIIIALLATIMYFVRKQRVKQVAVIYKSTLESSSIAGSDEDNAETYCEIKDNFAPIPGCGEDNAGAYYENVDAHVPGSDGDSAEAYYMKMHYSVHSAYPPNLK